MATISEQIVIESSADDVWEVIGDFAQGPSRMAPGFVADTRSEADCRIVTFVDGSVARERCVSVEPEARRIVYSVIGGTVEPEHDNAAMQVFADGERRCRLVWTRDVLPADLAAPMAKAMSHGLSVIKRTLDDHSSGRSRSAPPGNGPQRGGR